MKLEERVRLFDALLGEGIAIADGEAGDTETVRRWATKVAAARRQYREDVEQEWLRTDVKRPERP
jgi:hypothetical protein